MFCCLAARQYIKEPNYEKEFIGWVIRTYYKIKKEQNPNDDVIGTFSVKNTVSKIITSTLTVRALWLKLEFLKGKRKVF